jgi:hypothetical protein
VAAVEVAHPVSAVVGGRHPVGMFPFGPARSCGRPDSERAELVEGENPVREAVHDPSIRSSFASRSGSGDCFHWVKNDRLNHVGYLWAFAVLRHSPGADALCRRRREIGDWHAAAQRNLFNRMIGQLYHCLQHRKRCLESLAFGTAPDTAVPCAA